jgi:hypothetical protein
MPGNITETNHQPVKELSRHNGQAPELRSIKRREAINKIKQRIASRLLENREKIPTSPPLISSSNMIDTNNQEPGGLLKDREGIPTPPPSANLESTTDTDREEASKPLEHSETLQTPPPPQVPQTKSDTPQEANGLLKDSGKIPTPPPSTKPEYTITSEHKEASDSLEQSETQPTHPPTPLHLTKTDNHRETDAIKSSIKSTSSPTFHTRASTTLDM